MKLFFPFEIDVLFLYVCVQKSFPHCMDLFIQILESAYYSLTVCMHWGKSRIGKIWFPVWKWSAVNFCEEQFLEHIHTVHLEAYVYSSFHTIVQSWLVVNTKSGIFTIWPFTERVCKKKKNKTYFYVYTHFIESVTILLIAP